MKKLLLILICLFVSSEVKSESDDLKVKNDLKVKWEDSDGREFSIKVLSKEFDYKITAFHHAVEAYKIADLLADEGICAALWADWWGFKHEAYDMVQANVAIVDQARNGTGCAIVHSDDPVGIQHLNEEAAKAMAAGNRAGFNISKAHAMRWITSNPARAAGILDQTGSIEVGKDADIVLWSGNPFSVYSRAEKVLIDGALAFDINDPKIQPITDFDLGIIQPEENRVQ